MAQVPPGFTRSVRFPPERLFCQVETLVTGQAIERARQPERFIVGCADPGAPLPGPYAAVLGAFGCPILPMRYESAELAKIAINCCLAATVTVANTLAELSERVSEGVETSRRQLERALPQGILLKLEPEDHGYMRVSDARLDPSPAIRKSRRQVSRRRSALQSSSRTSPRATLFFRIADG